MPHFRDTARSMKPPAKLEDRFRRAVKEEQLHDIERLWYRVEDEQSPFARQLVQLIDQLGDKYQVDELAAKYEFTGRTPMTVPQAIEIKEELEEIDRLLKQLEEAAKTAQIGVIDLEDLAEFAEPGDIEKLNELAQHDRGISPRPGRAARAGKDRPGLPAHAQGLPAVPGPPAGADFQQPPGLADRPAPGADRGRRARSRCSRPSPTSSATRWPTWTSPARSSTPCSASGAGPAGAAAQRRHHRPSHPQHAQVRDGRAAGHERLDALRRAVRQRQADGPGPRRPDPPRISGRFPAVHRDVHVRQAAAGRRGRHADAQAGDALSTRSCG